MCQMKMDVACSFDMLVFVACGTLCPQPSRPRSSHSVMCKPFEVGVKSVKHIY